ncbi:hypothetical protein ACP4OV_014497 [Aristida adscensionis]
MGGWNRRRRHGGVPRRPARPPPPPPDYGQGHCAVPLWEREFCSYVGGISWQRFCENKYYVSVYNSLDQWDDSGAFENFQNAKARFWANYHGQPSDIPLPDPDMYIDKVDHRGKVDPELVSDLDKVRLPFDSDNNLAPASGWGDTEADNKCTQNQSGNWDMYVEKPAEVNKWENNSRSNLGWGVKHEPSNKWGDSTSGWGNVLADPSWQSWSNNHYSSNNWSNNFHGGANNRYQGNISGRKRDRGGSYQQRNWKQRNHPEDYHQDDRGRQHNEWRRQWHNGARENGRAVEGGW